jgi:hypothetical protein
LSATVSDSPRSTITNDERSSSVAVSFGRRGPKCISPAGLRSAPTRRATPRSASPVASTPPRIDVWATTTSPSASANTTMKSPGEVAER